MSFITDVFRAIRNHNPVEKIVLAQDVGDNAIQVAKKLIGTGSAASTAAQIGTQKADNLSSGAADEFFMGTAPERATAAQIENNRLDGGESPNDLPELVSRNMTYPPDLGDYFMMFQFYEYQRPTPFSTPTLNSLGVVTLPIPRKLEERHEVSWREKEAGILGDIADIVSHSMNDETGNNEGATGAASGAATRALITGVGKKIAVASILPGDLDKHFGQAVGAIMNPHLTQFFEGPTFQNWRFQWTFHPRSPDESNTVRDICREFKKRMLPARAVANVSSFLAYPAMVDVSVHPNEYLVDQFKKCAITSVNIDYTAGGQLLTFKGTKAPRVITLSIELKGIEYFLSEDFGGEAKYQDAEQFQNDLENKFNRALDTGKNIGRDILGDAGDFIFGGD